MSVVLARRNGARFHPRGWQLVKRTVSTQIGGVIALAMACEVAEHTQPTVRPLGWA